MDDTSARTILDAETARLMAARSAVQRDRADIQEEDARDPIADASLLEREIDESLLQEIDDELRAVEAARLRLAAGTYGRCEACGSVIPDDRLRAVPATSRCAAHQAEAEILIESRLVEGTDSPSDAASLAAAEAARNLDLVPTDDVVPDEESEASTAAEDLAVHARES